MRLPRPQAENCCVHVTHRCQERRLLPATDIDRKQYIKRLWQASRRFRTVRVLNYMITGNHIHLLTWAPRVADLSAMMHWLQGTYAGDYNRRVSREGAFWRGRFHPTLVETGTHLSRCLIYLDMNMVRAGVAAHPRKWRFSGYHELNGSRKRYRITDHGLLLRLLDFADVDAFRHWYERTLAELCRQKERPREPHWSRAFAVGSRAWLNRFARGDSRIGEHVRLLDAAAETDPDTTCVLSPPQSLRQRMWHALTAGGVS